MAAALVAVPAGAALVAGAAGAASAEAVPVAAASVAAPAAAANRSHDRAGRLVGFGRAEQVELHPRDVVPAAVFPFDAPIQPDVSKPE